MSVNKPLSEIKFDKVKPKTKKYKQFVNSCGFIDDTPMSFDIETSNGFYKNGVVYPFDKTKGSSFWEDYEKVSIMYIWQFGVKDCVFYGRTIEDLIYFLDDLEEVNPDYKFVYVHNLGFEFNAIIREYFHIEELFARKERHPLYLRLSEYNIEMRCSYQLTNLSLENCVKEYKLNTQKLDTLDYLDIKTPNTELSQSELQYCFNDVLIVNELMSKYRDEYSGLYNVPLTQTGEVRREVRKILSKRKGWNKLCYSLNSFTFEEYCELITAMTGGATHANRLYVNNVIDKGGDIFCFDFREFVPVCDAILQISFE